MQLCNTLILTYRIDYNEYTGGARHLYVHLPQPRPKDPKAPSAWTTSLKATIKALTDLLWKQLMADNNVSTRQELEDMGYATTGDLEPSRISTWTQRNHLLL